MICDTVSPPRAYEGNAFDAIASLGFRIRVSVTLNPKP